jgi:Uma2 family endonuclease
LLSPTDHLAVTQQKMLEYLANGAELGWLIDPEVSVSIFMISLMSPCLKRHSV